MSVTPLTVRSTQPVGKQKPEGDEWSPAAILGGLYQDGIIACKGAFSKEWTDEMREDIDRLFAAARAVEGGALPRGPERYYCEIAPEQLRGFVDIATHPWFVAVCTNILGPNYKIVEVGFDIPFPGAKDQPWHRDFPAPPPETQANGRRINSLAFNLTGVDTVKEMGPLHIAHGTQWDEWDYEADKTRMFPPSSLHDRYRERAVFKMPQRGDMSARSALTIHRGTANISQSYRPVLVIGVDAPDATNANHHDLQMTKEYIKAIPPELLKHITYREVDKIEMIIQNHQIEGLLTPDGTPSMGGASMGGAPSMGGAH